MDQENAPTNTEASVSSDNVEAASPSDDATPSMGSGSDAETQTLGVLLCTESVLSAAAMR